ncbi:MAG: rhodanese-like domain-containing protein [Desulfobacterales bacterium]|nr:rhodanese-like domain-containing protein [Desulfobacterales bacterium]
MEKTRKKEKKKMFNRWKSPGRYCLFVLCWCLVISLWQLNWGGAVNASEIDVSGRLINGFRVLDTNSLAKMPEFKVFRGDYIKFALSDNTPAVLSVPALDIRAELPPEIEKAPYFKMKKVGVFEFVIGTTPGTIRVVEYTGTQYQAVSAGEAAAIIKAQYPLVLDVRTLREYKAGHLRDATLIPVQELQRRTGELAGHQDKPILIYCASGNRSTVASKILIDHGFSRIYNMRRGIKGWIRQGLPVAK